MGLRYVDGKAEGRFPSPPVEVGIAVGNCVGADGEVAVG